VVEAAAAGMVFAAGLKFRRNNMKDFDQLYESITDLKSRAQKLKECL
jgi:hypothetical protein